MIGDIIMFGFVLFIANILFMGTMSLDPEFNYFFPTTLYRKSKMNMFGCIVCSILLFAVNYGYCTIYCIYRLIRWLFTVGR